MVSDISKMAIFVEGQTEMIFVEKLLKEIAGYKNIVINTFSMTGGRRTPRIRALRSSAKDVGARFSVVIVDCGTDNQVVSDICDQYQDLIREGYSLIIGIRDVHPLLRSDIPRFREVIATTFNKICNGDARSLLLLSVMEIETYFIIEHTHFLKVDASLTSDRIRNDFGFDPSVDDVELRDKPSEDMRNIYRSVNKGYNKNKKVIQRVVENLDYARLYLELPLRCPSLSDLIRILDDFLAI
jgi:hypothetical protein